MLCTNCIVRCQHRPAKPCRVGCQRETVDSQERDMLTALSWTRMRFEG